MANGAMLSPGFDRISIRRLCAVRRRLAER
jgi:hypothetical protein